MARFLASLLCIGAALATMAHTVQAIYPDNHFDYSTKLTQDNFESTIQSEIDAGKTVFVRWIASPGWGWWRKQATAWNTAVQTFAANEFVSFGDVNLAEESTLRGPPHNPGKGGWPTIRYFNQETGLEGGSYVQQQEVAICDELGSEKNMIAYIEDYGNTSLCSVVTLEGCNEQSIKYIEKMKGQGRDKILSQLDRLDGMDEKAMTLDLSNWLQTRKKILKQLTEMDVGDEL